jgi:outer membrane protein insertion porin family
VFDNLNNRARPSRGQRVVISQDFAGLGGNVKYLRTRFDAAKYWRPFGQFTFSVALEGGYILPFGNRARSLSDDKVRLTDRFFLGEPEMRGFDIRGVGPRVVRTSYEFTPDTTDGNAVQQSALQGNDDALGGRAYYKGRAELEIPLGSGAKELGLRPSIFVDVGSVFSLSKLTTANGGLQDIRTFATCTNNTTMVSTSVSNATTCPTGSTLAGVSPGFVETFLGDSWKPRVSVGVGVNWNSPFGPFRIDLAKALVKQPGDDTKLFTFNVGTQF